MNVFYTNPLKAELNPIRHMLALVGARHIVHVSRVWVNRYLAIKYCTAYLTFTKKVLLGHTASLYVYVSCNFLLFLTKMRKRTSPLCYLQTASNLWHHIYYCPSEDP